MKLSRKPTLIIAATSAIVLAGSVYGATHLGLFAGLARPASATQPLNYWEESLSPELTDRLTARIKAAGFLPVAAPSPSEADIAISKTTSAGASPILLASTGQPTKLTSSHLLSATSKPSAYLSTPNHHQLSADALQKLTSQIASDLREAPSNIWTLGAVGDIIIGRTVYLQMKRYDMVHPFNYFADTLKSTDLTIADLECSISDDKAVITDGGMTFVSPFASAAGLKTSGIDAVNLANNHSYNGGATGFTDTLDEMKRLGVATFGGGRNDAEAHSPKIMTVKGVKVALLGYSSIVGSQPASATSPGMAHLTMAPWGAFNEAEAVRMEQDIKTAKAQADVVMVYYHWGTEYTHDANADQRQIAHRAIDAGADLILGTHPHWVQGVEWYKDRLITYSLGNFVFDQEWSTKTKQGTILKASFDGARMTSAELVPYQIEDYQQPRPATEPIAKQILNDIYTHSWWPTK